MWPRSPNLQRFSAGAFDYLNKKSLIRFYYPIDEPKTVDENNNSQKSLKKSNWHPIQRYVE